MDVVYCCRILHNPSPPSPPNDDDENGGGGAIDWYAHTKTEMSAYQSESARVSDCNVANSAQHSRTQPTAHTTMSPSRRYVCRNRNVHIVLYYAHSHHTYQPCAVRLSIPSKCVRVSNEPNKDKPHAGRYNQPNIHLYTNRKVQSAHVNERSERNEPQVGI